jgi:transcriptional regulator with XRE-family HTH domain
MGIDSYAVSVIKERIRIARQEYGKLIGKPRYGRGSLAKDLGRDGPAAETIESWETGRTATISADYVAMLCQLTGISPSWVLGLTDEGDPRAARQAAAGGQARPGPDVAALEDAPDQGAAPAEDTTSADPPARAAGRRRRGTAR